MVVTAGCLGATDDSQSNNASIDTVDGGDHDDVKVIHDKERGVYCYIYEEHNWEQGGISCIPETDLPADTN